MVNYSLNNNSPMYYTAKNEKKSVQWGKDREGKKKESTKACIKKKTEIICTIT